jgi:hypothetical protein
MDYEGEEEDRRDSNRVEDPDDWVTGDKEMTGRQESYLETLAREAHQRVEPDLAKAEASKKIDVLRQKTGHGRSASRRRAPKTLPGCFLTIIAWAIRMNRVLCCY